jgi:hypothetical protein
MRLFSGTQGVSKSVGVRDWRARRPAVGTPRAWKSCRGASRAVGGATGGGCRWLLRTPRRRPPPPIALMQPRRGPVCPSLALLERRGGASVTPATEGPARSVLRSVPGAPSDGTAVTRGRQRRAPARWRRGGRRARRAPAARRSRRARRRVGGVDGYPASRAANCARTPGRRCPAHPTPPPIAMRRGDSTARVPASPWARYSVSSAQAGGMVGRQALRRRAPSAPAWRGPMRAVPGCPTSVGCACPARDGVFILDAGQP